MKLNRNLLLLIGLVFVIFTGTAYASSSGFLTQAQKYINQNCSKKNLTNQTALLCYLFNKSQEQDQSISHINTTLSPIPSQIEDLQKRVSALETPKPTPTSAPAAPTNTPVPEPTINL